MTLPDERHANRTASLLSGITDTGYTTSGSNEEPPNSYLLRHCAKKFTLHHDHLNLKFNILQIIPEKFEDNRNTGRQWLNL